MPEGHFVGLLYVGHSSNIGVLGNGHSNKIRFPIIAQRSKGAHYFHRVAGLVA